MNKMIKNLALGTSLLGVVSSCSSTWRQSESIDDKMSRYKSHDYSPNIVPDYIAINRGFSSRTPASTRNKKVDRGLTTHSNKRLYFLSLYTQYNDLQKYSTTQSTPQINYCPSFHTSFVDHKEKYQVSMARSSAYKLSPKVHSKLSDDNFIAFYPELSLPVSEKSSRPRVIDLLRQSDFNMKEANQVVSKAINLHLKKTYNEITELCETGSSSNYYTYENLMTHIRRKGPLRPNKKGTKTLLKTTVFSNLSLIKSLDAAQGATRGLASAVERSPYQDELADRLNIRWSKNYFKAIKNKK